MAAVGVGLVWWAYWWGISGVSLVKGWNNNVVKLANPLTVATFTTQCYTGPGVWPTGASGDSGACSGAAAPSVAATAQKTAAKTAKAQGRPIAGSVQGRL